MNTWSDSYAARPSITRCVAILLIANTVMYVIQVLATSVAGRLFGEFFALSVPGIMRGRVWQLVTYMFLHAGVLHLVLNMVGLFFLGPELERTMGPRRFLSLYFLSGMVGGLSWLALTYPSATPCVGASGAVFGILGAFAGLFPNRQLTILVFYVLPVTLRAWVLVVILSIVQLLYIISPGTGNVANAAHLGGVIVGFSYAMIVYRPGEASSWIRSKLRRAPKARPATYSPDVDRLLDKIAREGMQSLTASERMILEQASRQNKSGRSA